MQFCSLVISIAVLSRFASSASSGIANPVAISNITSQSSLTCANVPQNMAGTHLPRSLSLSSRSSLQRRVSDSDGIVWCRPHGTTFIRIIFTKPVAMMSAAAIEHLLAKAVDEVKAHIHRPGISVARARNKVLDASEPAWHVGFEQFSLYPLTSTTSGGGGMTYGTLLRALGVLQDFMATVEYGTGMVKVWEGSQEVGTILIVGF